MKGNVQCEEVAKINKAATSLLQVKGERQLGTGSGRELRRKWWRRKGEKKWIQLHCLRLCFCLCFCLSVLVPVPVPVAVAVPCGCACASACACAFAFACLYLCLVLCLCLCCIVQAKKQPTQNARREKLILASF